MSTVAVLGGGIAGLSSAYFLSRLPLTNISKVEALILQTGVQQCINLIVK